MNFGTIIKVNTGEEIENALKRAVADIDISVNETIKAEKKKRGIKTVSLEDATMAKSVGYAPEKYKSTLMKMQGGTMNKKEDKEEKKKDIPEMMNNQSKEDSSSKKEEKEEEVNEGAPTMSSMCEMKDKLKEMALKELKGELMEELFIKQLGKKIEKKMAKSIYKKLF